MHEPVEIRRNIGLVNVLQFAEEVSTEEGNVYYRFPDWFQRLPNGSFILHRDMPSDLGMFVTKSGLGGDNPKPKPPKR